MARIQTRDEKRRLKLDKLSLGLLIAFALLAIVTTVVAFIVVRNLVNTWNVTSIPGAPDVSGAQATAKPGETQAPPARANSSAGEPTAVPWDGVTRVNMLVMGLDYRDWQAGDVPRTDSMILVTVDPVTKTAGMLSIPRDMWVNVPGFDYNKINTAYFLGEVYKVPGGGPALAVKTVEEFLGVPIQYYAQIDFNAFAKFIDELGGLDINVRETIHLAKLNDPDGFDIQPGVQTLDGPTALAYARARYTEGDDFARAQRQQDVIMAIRDQVLQFNMLPTLIAKAPAIYTDLSAGIRTNMTLDQMIKLAQLATQVDRKRIVREVISADAATNSKSPDGLDILIPIPDKVREARDKIFTISGSVGPSVVGENPVQLRSAENSRISVQNGTQTPDLAAQIAQVFRSNGLNVVEEINSDQPSYATVIIVYSSKPYTVSYLTELLQVPASRIFNRFNPDSQVDVAVVLGPDTVDKIDQLIK